MWLMHWQADHTADRAAWEALLAQRDADAKQFLYTVRGSEVPSLSGSIPHAVFEAEPDSALAQMYNGKWEYCKDAQGRANVNSNPAHWPLILDWLSFGTIPADPTKEFLSECSYWQLTNLLEAIDTKQGERLAAIESKSGELTAAGVFLESGKEEDSHHFVIKRLISEDSIGFEMQGHICRYQQRLAAATSEASEFRVPFSAVGRDWALGISQKGCFLYMLKGMPLSHKMMKFAWGSGTTMKQISYSGLRHYTAGKIGYGDAFAAFDETKSFHADPRLVDLEGRVQLAVTVMFCPFKP